MPATMNCATPSYTLTGDELGPFDPELRTGAIGTEWLLTNGLGSYAMGTALSVPTRKYHGLLIAALAPPAQRTMTLAHLGDRLVFDTPIGQAEHWLAQFHFKDEKAHPDVSKTLVRFDKSAGVRWTHWVPCGSALVRVTKRVRLCDGRNAVEVRYTISPGPYPWTLHLKPLVAMRDHHDLCTPNDALEVAGQQLDDHTICVERGDARLHIRCEGATITPQKSVWEGLHYAWEARRGQPDTEDLLRAGRLSIGHDGRTPKEIVLVAWTDERAASGSERDVHVFHKNRSLPLAARSEAFDKSETNRRHRCDAMARSAMDFAGSGVSPDDRHAITSLTHAADDFVVVRTGEGEPGVSIIAGYPWFMDWGRDTMIALPGLLLTTGRCDEALATLTTFARARKNGLIPNRFDDDAGPAHYNTVDASLWFVHACCAWLDATGDRDAFMGELLPACADIIGAYEQGTDYEIGTDPTDGLVAAGCPETQLTWMDAKRDGVTFTPRWGKPVEINALWHNALASLAHVLCDGDTKRAQSLRMQAERVRASFVRAFTGGPAGGLADCLTPDGSGGWVASAELRPNQIFAASLPHGPLDQPAARAVVGVVRDRLLTPFGLRTLGPRDPAYKGRFEGRLVLRDGAYHNGTVWPWLIGPYAEAVMRVDGFSAASRTDARRVIDPLIGELNGTSLGQLWEVYDGDEPHRPDGCNAQAWSVAEVLRVLVLCARSDMID